MVLLMTLNVASFINIAHTSYSPVKAHISKLTASHVKWNSPKYVRSTSPLR